MFVSENIHNYGEDQNCALLRCVWDALKPGGRVAIKDTAVASDRSGPRDALRFAVDMSIFSENGGVYPVADVLNWLEAIGFEQSEVHHLEASAHSYLVVATRP